MTSFRNLLKSRTVWFAMLLAALSVLQGYIGIFKLDPQTEMLVGIGIAVAVTLLRVITTQPIAQK